MQVLKMKILRKGENSMKYLKKYWERITIITLIIGILVMNTNINYVEKMENPNTLAEIKIVINKR
jgi:hypothetical protein